MRTWPLSGGSATARTWRRAQRLSLASVCALALGIVAVPALAQSPAAAHDDPQPWLIAQGSQVPFPKIDGGGGSSRPPARQTTPSAPATSSPADGIRQACAREIQEFVRMQTEHYTPAQANAGVDSHIQSVIATPAAQLEARLRSGNLGVAGGSPFMATYNGCLVRARLAQLRQSESSASARSQVTPPQAATIPAPAPAPAAPAQRRVVPPPTAPEMQELAFREGRLLIDELIPRGQVDPAPRMPMSEPKPEIPGEDAKQCLEPRPTGGPTDEARIFNTCPYTVNGLWCVQGFDCKPYYSNNHNFEVGTSYPINGTAREGQGRIVQFGGCRGRDSIRGSQLGFDYYCRKSLTDANR